MQVTITNLSSTDSVYWSSGATLIAPSASVTTVRTQGQVDDDLQLKTLVAAGSVSVALTAQAGDELGGEAFGSDAFADGLVYHHVFAAGAGGSADDITLVSAATPFAMRVLEVITVTTTGVMAATCTLRTATGGAGTALSSAMAAASAGRTSSTLSTTTEVAAGSSLVLRRSDSGIAGEVIIRVLRTA